MQATRLFEIIYVLLRKNRTTAKELAEHFDVSQRTIYRDIDTLSLAGIPIYTEKGKGGGISLLPDFVLNKSILSETEQNDILSALQGFSGIGAEGAGGVLHKLSAVFNKTASHWLEVDFTDWGHQNGKTFSDLKTAILQRRIVNFDYYNTSSETTRRFVEPLQLWFKSKSWYVKGFCLLRQDLRLFKLTRMRNVSVTDKLFEERDLLGIEPEPSVECVPRKRVTVVLKIAAEMAYRVLDEFGDVERQDDGSYIIHATWEEDEWVYGFILSFGEYIEVLEPQYVRDILRKKLLSAARKYGGPPGDNFGE